MTKANEERVENGVTALFSFVKNYWVILAFIIQAVYNNAVQAQKYEQMSVRIADLSTEVDKLQAEFEKNNIVNSQVNARLASIETTLTFIREQVK